MAWIVLGLSGLLEVVWAMAMKSSDGFTKLGPSIVTMVAAGIGFWLLSFAMKDLPLGVAYPVWVGIGAIGTVVVGAVFLGESVNILRICSVLCIVAGIVGLRVSI